MLYRKRLTAKQWFLIAVMAVIGMAGVLALFLFKSSGPFRLYDTQVAAAERMKLCMEAVKEEKLARGIAIAKEDIFDTGLIGEDFNFITSTSGDIKAKRTGTDPDMAAMLVRMFDEAGLKEGSVLACNFSGSFPALNIAALCACDAMGVTPVYIASAGASTWGANNPGFSSPEMLTMLYEKGLVNTAPALFTPGGGKDTGIVPDPGAFAEIWQRVTALGYPVMVEEDFEKNVEARLAVYDGGSRRADAFLSVGGNITSLGTNMVIDLVGQGLIRETVPDINSGSGLIERFLHDGRSAILLLNIRRLVADYGLPFDPESRPETGTSAVYRETSYPLWIPAAALAAEAVLLVLFYRERRCRRDRGRGVFNK